MPQRTIDALDGQYQSAFPSFKVGENRVELQLAQFLLDGTDNGFHQTIQNILDETMVRDELEELRRIALQDVFHSGDLAIPDIRFHLAEKPEWMWALEWGVAQNLTRDESIRLLQLKYSYFNKLGWIQDATEENPVIHFQLEYLRRPEMPLLDLLKMDMQIPHGSEIFHRMVDTNLFLVSYIYAAYRQGKTDLLEELCNQI